MDLSLEFPGSYPDPSTKGLVVEKPKALEESTPALMPAGIHSDRSAPEPYELGIVLLALNLVISLLLTAELSFYVVK